jgi:hypothetical protein
MESDYSAFNAYFAWAIIHNENVVQLVRMEIIIDVLGSCRRDMSKLVCRGSSHRAILGQMQCSMRVWHTQCDIPSPSSDHLRHFITADPHDHGEGPRPEPSSQIIEKGPLFFKILPVNQIHSLLYIIDMDN